jgi:hypothetical protein
MTALRDLRNRFDFFVRSRLQWGRAVDADAAVARDAPLQAEFDGCLARVDWSAALAGADRRAPLVVADVGCRTFLFAPVIERRLAAAGHEVELHGLELDAWRRFTDLRTRHDYGRFWASRVKRGRFHPIDVRDFRQPLDVALLLNPFVKREPLLRWGLPLSAFAPEAIVAHLHQLLRPRGGLLLTSNPFEEELAITKRLCSAAGFRAEQEFHWQATPPSESTDRWCMVWRCDGASPASA